MSFCKGVGVHDDGPGEVHRRQGGGNSGKVFQVAGEERFPFQQGDAAGVGDQVVAHGGKARGHVGLGEDAQAVQGAVLGGVGHQG